MAFTIGLLGMWGFGFQVQSLGGFGIKGLGLRVLAVGFSRFFFKRGRHPCHARDTSSS